MKRENVIRAAKAILAEIQLTPRGNTTAGAGQGRGKPVTVRLPVSLIEAIAGLGGARTYHFERALKFYLMIEGSRKE
jgi:hypothetical protein